MENSDRPGAAGSAARGMLLLVRRTACRGLLRARGAFRPAATRVALKCPFQHQRRFALLMLSQLVGAKKSQNRDTVGEVFPHPQTGVCGGALSRSTPRTARNRVKRRVSGFGIGFGATGRPRDAHRRRQSPPRRRKPFSHRVFQSALKPGTSSALHSGDRPTGAGGEPPSRCAGETRPVTTPKAAVGEAPTAPPPDS